jgi:CheY-like chemotaxis protein
MLLVDDEKKEWRDPLEKLFTKLGFRVVTAANSKEAKTILTENNGDRTQFGWKERVGDPIDIVVSDNSMSGFLDDGLDLFAWVKGEGTDPGLVPYTVPFILFTSQADGSARNMDSSAPFSVVAKGNTEITAYHARNKVPALAKLLPQQEEHCYGLLVNAVLENLIPSVKDQIYRLLWRVLRNVDGPGLDLQKKIYSSSLFDVARLLRLLERQDHGLTTEDVSMVAKYLSGIDTSQALNFGESLNWEIKGLFQDNGVFANVATYSGGSDLETPPSDIDVLAEPLKAFARSESRTPDEMPAGVLARGKDEPLMTSTAAFNRDLLRFVDIKLNGRHEMRAEEPAKGTTIEMRSKSGTRAELRLNQRSISLEELRRDPILGKYVTEDDIPGDFYRSALSGKTEIFYSRDFLDPVSYKGDSEEGMNGIVRKEAEALADLADLSGEGRIQPLKAVGINGQGRFYTKLENPPNSAPFTETGVWRLLTPFEKIDFLTGIAETLQKMHVRGWVHGDVKAASLLIAGPLLNKGGKAIQGRLINFERARKFDRQEMQDGAAEFLSAAARDVKDFREILKECLQFQHGDMKESGLQELLKDPAVSIEINQLIDSLKKAREYFAKDKLESIVAIVPIEQYWEMETQYPEGLRSSWRKNRQYPKGYLVVDNKSKYPKEGTVIVSADLFASPYWRLENNSFAMWDRAARGYLVFE